MKLHRMGKLMADNESKLFDNICGGSPTYTPIALVSLLVLPQLRRGLGWVSFLLVLGVGVAYTAGSVVYVTKRPDPRPATFGFYEVSHSCTLVAAGAHYAAIVLAFLGRR